MIKEQYEDLENLGEDLISSIDDTSKLIPVFEDMLIYINDNYVNILKLEDIISSSSETIKLGYLLYNFIVIDCFQQFIPSYLNSINCINIKDFDRYYRTTLKSDSSNFKTNFIRIINNKIELLLKLGRMEKSTMNNTHYQELLKKYKDYIELINFGDSENFVINYFNRILVKYSDEIPGMVMGG